MLQIRLSKGSSGEGGGGPAKPPPAAETVTVACPDHLVLADLPVAKSLGAVTASAVSATRTIGRRSRRPLGERVHICSRCDFPIAIYGRLIPCEHAFCLTCARSDSSCHLCDERIQKIQSIKMMEGIFICAAPHCLKSFLKRTEFESHIQDSHANLLQNSTEKEAGNEAESQKQSLQPESSTARAPPRPGFSPNSNSQLQDREERSRHHQSWDQQPPKPPGQPKLPAFHSRQQQQPGESQAENNPSQGPERPYNWIPQPPSFENQGGPPPDKQAGMPLESSFANFPPLPPHQPPNFAIPMNMNQPLVQTQSFGYPPLPQDGTHQYYAAPYQMQLPDVGQDQGSVLGVPPAPSGTMSFPEGFPRPWGMGIVGMPFQPISVGQGIPEGFANPADPQGGVAFFQPDFGRAPDGSLLNPRVPGKELQGGPADHNESKGVLVPPQLQMPLPHSLPPPPPLPPPSGQQPFSRA
ncbi:E3 ubiquitin-protein ligase HAKAI homolog [Typha angustifolia]|uniref:E3 ubiquitin-protein ligase HAKAI homolog n=1 Tax=Typha angustifolia TaxID=59011 RepID=UPI003C2CEC2E